MIKLIINNRPQPSSSHTIYVTESTFSGTPLDDYNKEALDLIESISNYIVDGKSVKEQLLYDNFSFWWIIYLPLIRKMLKLTKFIENFSNFLQTKKPDEIHIVGNFQNLSIIEQCAKKYNIKLKVSLLKKSNFYMKQKINLFIKKSVSKKLTVKKIKRRKKIFLKKNKILPDSNHRNLFITKSTYRRNIFNSITDSFENSEWLVQDIIDLFDKSHIIGVDLFSHIRENDNVLHQRINSNLTWFPIEMIFDEKELDVEVKNFFQNFEKIINNSLFQEQFQIHGILFWNQVKEEFHKMKNYYNFPYHIVLIESLNRYFRNQKPKAIFLPYEYGQQALCVISIAKKFNIKTIGIAHSIIYENHYGYSHRNFASKEKPFNFPLPDHTLLFGEYSKKILTNQGYPEKKLIVFGKSEYFNLEKIKLILKEKDLRKKYNLSKNSKVILFTSQKFQKNYEEFGSRYDYDSQIWETLLKNFGNKTSYFLVLKPHPREKNISIYENLIQKYNVNNAEIIQNNLFELLSISDIVISYFSNSLLDALCFQKFVIRVRFGSYVHPIFDNSKAILVSSLDNLPETICKILSNIEIQTDLISESFKLIKEQLNIPLQNPKKILDDIIEDKNNHN